MNNPEDFKFQNITINIICIILFGICLIDNICSVYLNHLKFNFDMIFAISDAYLVIYNTRELFNKIKHNKKLEQIKH